MLYHINFGLKGKNLDKACIFTKTLFFLSLFFLSFWCVTFFQLLVRQVYFLQLLVRQLSFLQLLVRHYFPAFVVSFLFLQLFLFFYLFRYCFIWIITCLGISINLFSPNNLATLVLVLHPVKQYFILSPRPTLPFVLLVTMD